jgi:hypothetical protein
MAPVTSKARPASPANFKGGEKPGETPGFRKLTKPPEIGGFVLSGGQCAEGASRRASGSDPIETLVLVFGVLLGGIAYSAVNGIWPSLYGEMFSTKVRISGMAIGTQLGFTLAAQAPTLAAFFTRQTPSEWTPVAWLVTLCCAISAVVVLFARETNRVSMIDLGRKSP